MKISHNLHLHVLLNPAKPSTQGQRQFLWSDPFSPCHNQFSLLRQFPPAIRAMCHVHFPLRMIANGTESGM
jgi:hypothetical protein